jgi:hypothetical protein
MSIWIQPDLVDAEEEMAQLGLCGEISVRAYLMARQDLLAGTIDAYELADTATRNDRLLSNDSAG